MIPNNSIVVFIIALFSLLSATKASSQTNPYIGTWKYQNGSEIFYVTFYNERAQIKGKYRKVVVNNNGVEVQEIYRSNKFIIGSTTEWPSCINVDYDNVNNKIGGDIMDNTIDFSNHPGRTFKSGVLRVKLLPSCTGCPITAEWKVKRQQGIQLEGEPDYNIPTDIIITKVN